MGCQREAWGSRWSRAAQSASAALPAASGKKSSEVSCDRKKDDDDDDDGGALEGVRFRAIDEGWEARAFFWGGENIGRVLGFVTRFRRFPRLFHILGSEKARELNFYKYGGRKNRTPLLFLRDLRRWTLQGNPKIPLHPARLRHAHVNARHLCVGCASMNVR